MKAKRSKKKLTIILCMASIVAMTLFTAGCSTSTGSKEPNAATEQTNGGTDVSTEASTDTSIDTSIEGTEADKGPDSHTSSTDATKADGADGQNPSTGGTKADGADGKALGEGKTVFDFTVVDQDGKETTFEIHTDKETVGDALQELDLISGEEGEYGLFVDTVNGITVDYDKDGVYWAFYINGEYAQTGVSATAVTEGDSYSFKVE